MWHLVKAAFADRQAADNWRCRTPGNRSRCLQPRPTTLLTPSSFSC